MRRIVVLLFVSILYIGAVFLAVQGKTFRLDSDYDSNFPIIAYVVDTIRHEGRFPLRNPLVGSGISVLGDPLSGVTYLPYLLPMLVFGVPDGWWIVVWLHAFGAGIAMWLLLRSMRVSAKLSVWGGLLYMGSGAFAARVAAGHVEKVLSYPWYPVFLFFLLRRSALSGAVAGVFWLTGDVYGLLFLTIFSVVIGVIGEIRGIRESARIAVAFFLVAAVKLVPFLREVAPVMERFGVFDPVRGSLDIWWSWIPFVMPIGVEFYDRPFFQRLFGFWYNWYEYYAFIGLPIVFVLGFPKVIKRREARILALLFAVGIAFIARGSVYSPFYGLALLFPWFRTPQRMYGAITSVIVVLIVLCAKRVKKPAVLGGMLVVTFLVSGWQMTNALKTPTNVRDSQLYRIREKQVILDYYYGWKPREP